MMGSRMWARRVTAAATAVLVAGSGSLVVTSAVAAEPVPSEISGLKTEWRVPAGSGASDAIRVTPAATALQVQRKEGAKWRVVDTQTSGATGAVTVEYASPFGVTNYRIVVPGTDAVTGSVSETVTVTGYRTTATISDWDTTEAFVKKGTTLTDQVRATPAGATVVVQRRTGSGPWKTVSQRVVPADRRFTADLGKIPEGDNRFRVMIPSQPLVGTRAVTASRVVVGYGKIPPIGLLPKDLNRLLMPLGIPKVHTPFTSDGDTARAVCVASELSGYQASRRQPNGKFRAVLNRTSKFRKARRGMVNGVNVSRGCQAAYFVKNRKVLRAVPVSTGRSGYPTNPGTFHVFRSVNGKETSAQFPDSHWNMYRSLYFNSGEALHGSYSDLYVRTFPDSHGCVRMLHRDVDWLWRKGWTIGTTVRVYGNW